MKARWHHWHHKRSHVPFFFCCLFDHLPVWISTLDLHHRTQRTKTYQIRACDFGVQFSFKNNQASFLEPPPPPPPPLSILLRACHFKLQVYWRFHWKKIERGILWVSCGENFERKKSHTAVYEPVAVDLSFSFSAYNLSLLHSFLFSATTRPSGVTRWPKWPTCGHPEDRRLRRSHAGSESLISEMTSLPTPERSAPLPHARGSLRRFVTKWVSRLFDMMMCCTLGIWAGWKSPRMHWERNTFFLFFMFSLTNPQPMKCLEMRNFFWQLCEELERKEWCINDIGHWLHKCVCAHSQQLAQTPHASHSSHCWKLLQGTWFGRNWPLLFLNIMTSVLVFLLFFFLSFGRFLKMRSISPR